MLSRAGKLLSLHILTISFCISNSMTPLANNTGCRRGVREVLRKPPKHWVGDGFNVYPVFADKAFTQGKGAISTSDFHLAKKTKKSKTR